MNLESVIERLNALGYRKSTGKCYTDEGLEIIDFQKKRKGLEMYSAFLDETGSVRYLEYTKLKWHEESKNYRPEVTKIYSLSQLPKA